LKRKARRKSGEKPAIQKSRQANAPMANDDYAI